MRYCEYNENGYVIGVGTGAGGIEVDKARHDAVIAALVSKPAETETIDYRLKEDLTWEPYEVEPTPEPEPDESDKAAAYDILVGEVE